jgi:3-hydroxyisobutyrate dehydrogenase-like beta-hydroxyacid dehydrogenase
MTHRETQISVLGLGLMGQALAGAFVRDGHAVTVWNRTGAKAAPLVAQGARLAGSAAEAVAASPLVIVCVSDYGVVREIVPAGLDGRVVVNLTSGTSAQAREAAEWAAGQGATYLDGAIMAVPPAIGSKDTVILYSGPRSAFDRYEPELRSLGAGTTYLGADHGLASLHDVAVLGLMWSILNGFLHGAALLGAAGIKATQLTPILTDAIGTVAEWLPGYARQIDDGAYPALDSTLDTHVAAMGHLIHESEALGVDAELPRLIKSLAERAVADGHGGDSYPVLVEQFRSRD